MSYIFMFQIIEVLPSVTNGPKSVLNKYFEQIFCKIYLVLWYIRPLASKDIFYIFLLHKLLIQNIKIQRNEHKFSKIVISLLKIGKILAFIIIYPINISLKIFLITLRENSSCKFKFISSSKIFLFIYEVLSIAPRSCL